MTYEHYTALVPDWWRGDLAVDELKLAAIPDALQDAVEVETVGAKHERWP